MPILKRKEPPDKRGQVFHTTLRCSLGGRLRDHKWRGIFEDAVNRTSRTMYLTTLLINAHFVRLCECGSPLPEKINQTFIYRCSSAVSAGASSKWGKEDPELLRTYNQVFADASYEAPSISGLSQTRNECCRLLVTLFDTYNDDAMAKHQRTYICAKYGLSKTHARWLVGQIRVIDRDPTVPDKYPEIWTEKYEQFPDGKADILTAIEEERRLYDGFRKTPQGKTQYRFQMLQLIHSVDPERQRFRRFSLFPEHRPHRRFVPITASTLKDMVAYHKLPPHGIHDVFDLSEFQKSGWEVQMCRTDGVQLHVVRHRTVAVPNTAVPKKPKGDADAAATTPAVVGVDPGYVYVYTAAWTDVNGDVQTDRMSRVQFRHKTGGDHATFLLERRKKAALEVQDVERQWAACPMTGCVAFEAVAVAAQLRVQSHGCIYRFYSTRKAAKLRFQLAQKRQRVFDELANRFMGLDRDIIWGNGSDGHSAGGRSGGPVKRLVEHLTKKTKRVTLVDEYNTSQMCCHGHGRLDPVWRRNEDGSAKRVYGLFTCKTCSKIVDRDVNAALNISRLHGCQRPPDLCRGHTVSTQVTDPSTDRCKCSARCYLAENLSV